MDSFDCQECGQRVDGVQFHSYESCLIYKWDHAKLTQEELTYFAREGYKVMAERIARKEVPWVTT